MCASCERARRENLFPRAIRDLRSPFCAIPRAAMLAGALALVAPLAALAQTNAVPARITAQINESNLTTLRGNTHPLARPQYDQGAVADSQPMRRMLLLLQRSPAAGNRPQNSHRPAAEQVLAELPSMAHPAAIRPAVWPRRRRYSGRHQLAAIARLPDRASFDRRHADRVFRHGRASAQRFSYRDPQVCCERQSNTSPTTAIRKSRRRLLPWLPDPSRFTIFRGSRRAASEAHFKKTRRPGKSLRFLHRFYVQQLFDVLVQSDFQLELLCAWPRRFRSHLQRQSVVDYGH